MSKIAARKMILSYLIFESKSLRKEDKIKLLRFVRDKATPKQLRGIVTESRVVSIGIKKIKKIDKFILEQKEAGEPPGPPSYSAAHPNVKAQVPESGHKSPGMGVLAGMSPIMGIYLGSFLIGKAYSLARDWFTKAARKCNDLALGTQERRDCEKRAKLGMINIQMQNLNGAKAQCAKGKKPEQCAAKIDEKIKKLEAQAKEIEVTH